MERFTNRIKNLLTGETTAYSLKTNKDRIKAIFKFGKWEDAEEEGRLLILPCAPGTPYWTFDSQFWIDEEKCKGCQCYFSTGAETFCDSDEEYPGCTQIIEKRFNSVSEIASAMPHIGKTIFLTPEGAVQAIAKLYTERFGNKDTSQ